jgi:cellulose 1,4-beta-cellobiosidase
MKAMGESFKRGMVLVMSLWDDHYARMLWLDSSYPLDQDPAKPGVNRGSCSTDSGKPEEVESQHGDAHVMYYNVKVGDIGTTTEFN